MAWAGAIILHSFAVWAGYQEHKIVGNKYEEIESESATESFTNYGKNTDLNQEEIRRQREEKRKEDILPPDVSL